MSPTWIFGNSFQFLWGAKLNFCSEASGGHQIIMIDRVVRLSGCGKFKHQACEASVSVLNILGRKRIEVSVLLNHRRSRS